MTSTVFVDFNTPIVASWLNDINTTVYTALGSAGVAPATAAQVISNLKLFLTTGGTLTGQVIDTFAGDQFKFSQDTSPFRTGSWSVTASGSLYTLLSDFAMYYWTHNVAVDVNGNFLGRDAAGPCTFWAFTEGGFVKIYNAVTAAAGVVPTWTLVYSFDTNTGNQVYGGSLQTTQLTSTIATGTAPLVVSSTTPVANLSIGGNAATATNATNVTTTINNGVVATTQAQGDHSTKVATTAYVDGHMILGTPQATTSGTSITFSSIPSWVKKIHITFKAVGTSGTAAKLIQIGSGSVTNTGYLGASSVITTVVSTANFTTGFGVQSVAAADRLSGTITLTLENSSGNTWTAFGVIGASNGAGTYTTAGTVSLAGALDRVVITTANGTDTFAAGEANIMWE